MNIHRSGQQEQSPDQGGWNREHIHAVNGQERQPDERHRVEDLTRWGDRVAF